MILFLMSMFMLFYKFYMMVICLCDNTDHELVTQYMFAIIPFM